MKLTDEMKEYIDKNIDDLILKTFESPSMTPELSLSVWEYYYIKVIEKTQKYKEEYSQKIGSIFPIILFSY